MTKLEKVTHVALLDQIRDLEIEVHELRCIAGDYVDAAQELRCCAIKQEPWSPWVIGAIINAYLKTRR